MTSDEELTQSVDPTTTPTDTPTVDTPIVDDVTRCSACGLPLRVKNSGDMIKNSQIVHWCILQCVNDHLNGTSTPCSMLEQEQGRVETIIPQTVG